ncbi:hypothetical protein [Hyphomicrobium sp.]|uniref:hypothetical protein n=1 Tax=Hyphomicrobium sp. TaxID=82 RepID=UPI002BC4EA99|nr:hypothetical protein [Hyphomicrobium sp.]HVZ05101.1 hypothetical protein [Hyphomicrobium sp.]
MTYVDRPLGNSDALRFRAYFPRARTRIAQAERWGARSLLGMISVIAYLSRERGPTSSASLLAYEFLAATGSVLYESWDEDAHHRGRQGLVCERGCLRRMTDNLRLKAADEIRIHQEIFGRQFRRYHRARV